MLEETISLPEHYKSAMVQAIVFGNKKDILQFKMEYNLLTSNAINFLKWDFTNTNIIKTLEDDRLKCFKVKRGPWVVVLVYDTETKYLYSFMNEKRFSQLQERNCKDAVHYLDALALINKNTIGITKSSYQQLSFLGYDDKSFESDAENLLNDILSYINIEVNCFVLIVFSNNKLEITSVTAYIPTADLDIAYEENWNEHIVHDFDFSEIVTLESDEDEDEIEVRLRDGIILHNPDELVQLKNKDDEKDVEK